MLEIPIVIAIVGGGLLGAVAAVSTSKATTFKEKLWRTLTGSILAFVGTKLTSDYLNIQANDTSKTLGISFILGFAGWHVLSVLSILLDSIKDHATKEGGIALLIDILQFFKGKRNDR